MKLPTRPTAAAAVLLLLAVGSVPGSAPDAKENRTSPIKADESVTLFTTAAWPSSREGPVAWEMEVHGVIYEEESRPLVSTGIAKALDLKLENLTGAERDTLGRRTALFLVDNERGKSIPVLAGEKLHLLPPSESNGHFRQTITLTGDAVARASKEGVIPLQAVTRPGDERRFSGAVCVLPDGPQPLVISDVDDTIKVTEVRNREEMKLNTFCRPFQPVEGMASLYASWAKDCGAGFLYVTGSPWQLYRPLEEFRQTHSFPPGAWHMKHLRLMDSETIRALLAPQTEHKLSAIEPLLRRWPQRPAILVGDSGEQDPEIYGTLARRHPQRITRIFIRNVSGEPRDSERFRKAFDSVDPAKWQLFDKAAELPRRLP